MTTTCEALTLRTYPFGEANKIVLFLTCEFGLIRGAAYGAARSRSRFGPSLEPWTLVRLTFRRKEHQELVVVSNCEIIRALPAYELSWEQNLYSGYFAELLVEIAREEVESEKLFRLSLAMQAAIQKAPLSLLSRYFEFWLLKLEGVLPALTELLPGDLAAKTAKALKVHPLDLSEGQFTSEELAELESATSMLIEYHLEKPLKAKKMLKELL